MSLFTDQTGLYGHQVRLALAEKAITADIILIEDDQVCQD